MNKVMKAVIAAALLAAPLPTAIHIAQTAKAQDKAQEKLVAKVNGKAITESDMQLAEAEIGSELGSIPPEARRRVVLEYVIENQLFADAAEAAKLGSGAAFDERMNYWRRRALREYYFEAELNKSVSDADAKKFYDQQVSGAKAQEEVRARHILVETEAQAKELLERINKGEDFVALAKANSKDPGSKGEGGDLGYFGKGQMVPVFEETAFNLKPGQVSAPVQSQFGWHLVKLEDRRQRGAPPFDAIKERIIASMIHRKAQEVAADLRAKAQLEYVDPAIKAQIDQERAIKPVPAPKQ
ncbi:MAG: peptidylprolyl isomerase [Hyphomicrobium sp. SCN 65-11]|nr:MAG: peptidylprolyl isomerase [Hyphomicrobium sp. SCN 65-11]